MPLNSTSRRKALRGKPRFFLVDRFCNVAMKTPSSQLRRADQGRKLNLRPMEGSAVCSVIRFPTQRVVPATEILEKKKVLTRENASVNRGRDEEGR